jgi:hypothetical protein
MWWSILSGQHALILLYSSQVRYSIIGYKGCTQYPTILQHFSVFCISQTSLTSSLFSKCSPSSPSSPRSPSPSLRPPHPLRLSLAMAAVAAGLPALLPRRAAPAPNPYVFSSLLETTFSVLLTSHYTGQLGCWCRIARFPWHCPAGR